MPRLTYAARSGAGSTATLRFKRGMRSWRTVIVKRARWAFLLVGGTPIAIEIGRANHHALDWALGLTTGGTIALWLVLADSPPLVHREVAVGCRGRTMDRTRTRHAQTARMATAS